MSIYIINPPQDFQKYVKTNKNVSLQKSIKLLNSENYSTSFDIENKVISNQSNQFSHYIQEGI